MQHGTTDTPPPPFTGRQLWVMSWEQAADKAPGQWVQTQDKPLGPGTSPKVLLPHVRPLSSTGCL